MTKSKRIPALLFSLLAAASLIGTAAAVSEQTTTIPVTLTVVNTVRNIDVTMPAAMPVSVYNGKVLTADNVEITNNSTYVGVEVVSVSVDNGAYTVASYDSFPDTSPKKIALQINTCGTAGPGMLAINKTAFPNIAASTSLPINYKAKVSASDDVSGLKAANVVFTLRALESEE